MQLKAITARVGEIFEKQSKQEKMMIVIKAKNETVCSFSLKARKIGGYNNRPINPTIGIKRTKYVV